MEKQLSTDFLPKSPRFNEVSTADMEVVENDPEVFIIPECIDACKILWGKNIFTFMCSDYLNEDETWIEIIEDDLSDENKEIINQIDDVDIKKFRYHKGCINIGFPYHGEKARQKLIQMAGQLKMQDVPSRSTINTERALIESGYNKRVTNPNYDSERAMNDIFYDEYPFIIVFDPSKIDKPVEQILKENGYIKIQSEGKIYRSEYHYKKHLRYLEYLKVKEQFNLSKKGE